MTKEQVRQKLLELTGGCNLQGKVGGWPCGTCFGSIGLDPEHIGLWQSLLVYRGDYKADETDYDMDQHIANIIILKERLAAK